MKPLIFSGTTEGRVMSERLSGAGIDHIVCVATGYGELVMRPSSHADVRQGRLDAEAMRELIADEASTVFDATHPYAYIASDNIRTACAAAGKEYVRILRPDDTGTDAARSGRPGSDCDTGSECIFRPENAGGSIPRIRWFDSPGSCAAALAEAAPGLKGNILLTTGSKDLAAYAADPCVRNRLCVRVLPSAESIRLCTEAGISVKNIIAMHGPFSRELDAATIRQLGIELLVTKSSGRAGGLPEKLAAAEETGTEVFIIGRPEPHEEGVTVSRALEEHFGIRPEMKITLIGAGPGRTDLMSAAALDAVKNADILFGAPRMTDPFRGIHGRIYPYYLARDIIPVLDEVRPGSAAVLFSGDTGLSSGAARLRPALETWLDDSGFEGEIVTLPGISSVSYLSAVTGTDYSGAGVLSVHGRSGDDRAWAEVLRSVRYRPDTFVLLSGADDVAALGQKLTDAELYETRITIGRDLSYPDEEIIVTDAGGCLDITDRALYVALIHNHDPETRVLMPVLKDADMIRGDVPMTKEEIRHLSIAKLGLVPGSVVYDIGSGTGSVACEIAGLDESVAVYAFEMKDEACALIRCNAANLGLINVEVISGRAPETFEGIEPPDCAFIGGSSGSLREILTALADKRAGNNSNQTEVRCVNSVYEEGIRVVINAVTLETIAEIQSVIKDFDIADLTIEQISVSRARELGSYHLMTAENPVLIAAFTLTDKNTR